MNHATSSILEELPLNIFQKALIVHRTPTVKRKYLLNEPPNFHFLNHRTFNKYVKMCCVLRKHIAKYRQVLKEQHTNYYKYDRFKYCSYKETLDF